jgi:hypothetical protein
MAAMIFNNAPGQFGQWSKKRDACPAFSHLQKSVFHVLLFVAFALR